MTNPTSLMVCADGVEVRTFNVLPDGSDYADQLVAAADLCALFSEDGSDVATIVPQFTPTDEVPAAFSEPRYTVVLIDRDPEGGVEDGDFVAVIGVTHTDLLNPATTDWARQLADTMAGCLEREDDA